MNEDEFLSTTQLKLLPSQLEYLRGFVDNLRVLAARSDHGQPAVEQHIEESMESVLQLQGADAAAFRLAVVAMSAGATRNPATFNRASETITTSPILREDGRQVVAGLLGTATTLRNTQTHDNETAQRLVESASAALGVIRRSDEYGNPSMGAAELAVLSFYTGATLRNEDFDATQQLMDYASGLVPDTQV